MCFSSCVTNAIPFALLSLILRGVLFDKNSTSKGLDLEIFQHLASVHR